MSPNRRSLAAPIAIATLMLSLLAVPAAPAPMLSDFVKDLKEVPEIGDPTELANLEGAACGGAQTMEDSAACTAMWGCNNYHGTGTTGSITVNGDAHNVDPGGEWTDGCGGKRCDDNVKGTYDHGQGSFEIVEFKDGGQCKVFCEINGVTVVRDTNRDDLVNPQKANNGRWVTFLCATQCCVPDSWYFEGIINL